MGWAQVLMYNTGVGGKNRTSLSLVNKIVLPYGTIICGWGVL